MKQKITNPIVLDYNDKEDLTIDGDHEFAQKIKNIFEKHKDNPKVKIIKAITELKMNYIITKKKK